MTCPHCGLAVYVHNKQEIFLKADKEYDDVDPIGIIETHRRWVLKISECPHCHDVIVEMVIHADIDKGDFSAQSVRMLYPLLSKHKLPKEVPAKYAKDFLEAQAVLPVSPKSSAALSRRCLERFLVDEYQLTSGSLSTKIDRLLERNILPGYLHENIDVIRSFGNWSAHSKKAKDTGTIIEVEHGEAEWSLQILADLFDHQLIKPLIAAKHRERITAQTQEALDTSLSELGSSDLVVTTFEGEEDLPF